MYPNRLMVGVLVIFALSYVVYAHDVPTARPHIKVVREGLNIDAELAGRGRQRSATTRILTPPELRALYGISTATTAGTGQTIAVIDAYGASTVEEDLQVFSTRFGLRNCTTANGCFKKVNQTGGTKYPADNSGWGQETALDVQVTHSIAPGANILLVVANSDSLNDLFVAVTYAKAHANYVTMSFGGTEGSYVTSYDNTYFASSPQISFFASTGDSGAGVEYPSTSPHVVAVGGTSLITNSDYSLSSEQGWDDSGGGCSGYFTAPAVQSANSAYAGLGCSGNRAVPDVAMDGDPNSGVYVYYSYGCTSVTNCYLQVGGTSLAAPLFAARAAIRGAVVNVTYVYGTAITYRDITVGNNGYSCGVGLDLVTGRGSWNGS